MLVNLLRETIDTVKKNTKKKNALNANTAVGLETRTQKSK
jgi:hypothetical protein